MGEACGKYGRERRNAYAVWVEEPDENGPLGRPRCIRECKGKMCLI